MVKLYKIVNGELRLVDYGVLSQMEAYAAQGYIVIVEKWKGGEKWNKEAGL